MNNKKIYALGIAPYEGLKTLMNNIATERNDIDIDIIVGDLNEGVALAKKFHEEKSYDVIISRGGTAEMVKQQINIPVIEITTSIYDILSTIKLAENTCNRYSIIGFSSITNSAKMLCDLLQYKIDIITINGIEDAQCKLKEIKETGQHLVLCDMITNTLAKQIGLNPILITSGKESINAAFDQAVELCVSYSNIKKEKSFLYEILSKQSLDSIVYNTDKELIFSTNYTYNSSFYNMLKSEIPFILQSNTKKIIKNINDEIFFVKGIILKNYNEIYICFYINRNKYSLNNSLEIRYLNKEDASEIYYDDFYSINNINVPNIQALLDNYNKNNIPLFLSGEKSTGKEQLALKLYIEGSFSNNPLIIIDCKMLSDKNWAFLTNNCNSPFIDSDNTIYIKNVEHLSSSNYIQLFSAIIDSNSYKRNRLIFSYTNKLNDDSQTQYYDLINKINCLNINMPSLKEQKDYIPNLSSLYINSLNLKFGKQIIGFDPGAMDILKGFSWPYNLSQFKRVLQQLVILTNSAYISEEDTRNELKKEEQLFNSNKSFNSFNIDRTLDEINKEIINLVLKKNNGNQSLTAKQLGISRTTLWRILK